MFDPIAEIKSRLDIVDVVGQYVQLKKAGANFKGLSPFVSEKTPSFVVSPEKQIAYCFSSQKGGDIFQFVMEIENISFRDALELLADRAGVTLPKSEVQKEKADERTKIFNANKLAVDFFRHVLWETESGKAGRDYLEKRGVDRALAETFDLGVALDEWDMLSKALKKKGISDQVLIDAGLVVKREGKSGFYDKFRGRLMFPINNSSGLIVGFGARGMKDDVIPKYLNTAETPVYHKTHLLYNFDRAKSEIKKENNVVVVEGYMDVIASYKTAVRNVVASSGTALTVEHLGIIKRLTNKVSFAFDSDRAGVEAAMRAIELALAQDMDVYVVEIPNGKDADDCIKEDPALWEQACQNPIAYMDFIINQALKSHDRGSAEGRRNITKEVLSRLVAIPSVIQQDFYLQRLADELGVNPALLRQELQVVAANPGRQAPAQKVEEKKEKAFGKEDYIFGILMKEPDLFVVYDELSMNDYTNLSSDMQQRMQDLKMAWEKGELVNQKYDGMTGPLIIRIDELYVGFSREQLADELRNLHSSLGSKSKKEMIAFKIEELRRAEKGDDKALIMKLKEELQSLLMQKS